jgi:hypothetical protein
VELLSTPRTVHLLCSVLFCSVSSLPHHRVICSLTDIPQGALDGRRSSLLSFSLPIPISPLFPDYVFAVLPPSISLLTPLPFLFLRASRISFSLLTFVFLSFSLSFSLSLLLPVDHHSLYGVLHGSQEVHQEGAAHWGFLRMADALRLGVPQSHDG